MSTREIFSLIWNIQQKKIINTKCYSGATHWSIRTRDLTSSERSSKEAKGAGPMRFWRRLVDDTLVVAVTSETDIVVGIYWVGTMTGKQDRTLGS